MSIPEFRWWLADVVATAIRSLAQSIWSALEPKIHAVFKASRIGWTTETGLEIFWADTNIKPKVDTDLKRSFLQQYNNFLKAAGTPQDVELLKSFFTLAYVYSIDMRDHPLVSHLYPFHLVRFWIPAVDVQTETDINHIIVMTLPARCTKHYQLLTWYEAAGFGRTPFGRKFGR